MTLEEYRKTVTPKMIAECVAYTISVIDSKPNNAIIIDTLFPDLTDEQKFRLSIYTMLTTG
jgi:hypothetical protein